MEENVQQRVEAIKDSLTVYDVLAHYGENHSKQTTPHQISCPFRVLNHGKGTDNHRSARIYPRTNSVFCWSCGEGGDVIWIAQKMQGFKTCEETCTFLEKTFKLIKEKPDLTEKFIRAAKRFVRKKNPPDESRRKLASLQHVLDLELADKYRILIKSLTDMELLLVEAALDYHWDQKHWMDVESEKSGDYETWVGQYFDWYNRFRATLEYYQTKVRVSETLAQWKEEIDKSEKETPT